MHIRGRASWLVATLCIAACGDSPTAPSNPPALFSEGIAVAHQTNPSGNDLVATWNGTPLHNHARTYHRAFRLIPLGQIIDSNAFRDRDAEITYPQSGSFMRWLIDTHGLAKVKALFGRVAYPDPPAAPVDPTLRYQLCNRQPRPAGRQKVSHGATGYEERSS